MNRHWVLPTALLALLAGIGIGWLLFAFPAARDPETRGAPVPGPPAPVVEASPVPEAPPAPPVAPVPGGAPAGAARAGRGPSGGALSWERAGLRAEIEQALREEFRRKAGREIPGDVLRVRVDGLLGNLEKSLVSLPSRSGAGEGARLAARELLRDEAGNLSDRVEVLLQVRGNSRGHADMVGIAQDDHVRADVILQEPFDIDAPVQAGERVKAFARGGLIPLGKALVVERVEFAGRPGIAASSRDGDVELAVDETTLLHCRDATMPFRAVWTGAVVVRAGSEQRTRLAIDRGAAEARILGRLVDEDAAGGVKQEALGILEKETTGFLAGGRIVLQVLADNGGGNPQRLHLDGTGNGYFRTMSPDDLSVRVRDLAGLRDGVGHVEGGGMILPGRRLVIRRVDVRAKILPGKGSHGSVVVRIGGSKVFESKDTGGEEVVAAWTEGATIPAGEERSVYVEATYFSFVEAVITAEVE